MGNGWTSAPRGKGPREGTFGHSGTLRIPGAGSMQVTALSRLGWENYLFSEEGQTRGQPCITSQTSAFWDRGRFIGDMARGRKRQALAGSAVARPDLDCCPCHTDPPMPLCSQVPLLSEFSYLIWWKFHPPAGSKCERHPALLPLSPQRLNYQVLLGLPCFS